MRFGFKEFRKSPRSDSTEFRKRFPADITAAVGRSHFTCSVGVIGERQASAAYAKAFSRYQEKCEQLRREIAETAVPPVLNGADSPPKGDPTQIIVDPGAIEEVIERWRVAEIGRSYMDVANGLIDIDPLGTEAMRRSDLCVTLKEYQGYRQITDFDDRLLAALASQGIDLPDGHPVLRMLRPSFAAAWLVRRATRIE